jgi:hypothetical protein
MSATGTTFLSAPAIAQPQRLRDGHIFFHMGYPSGLSDQEWAVMAHHFQPKDR